MIALVAIITIAISPMALATDDPIIPSDVGDNSSVNQHIAADHHSDPSHHSHVVQHSVMDDHSGIDEHIHIIHHNDLGLHSDETYHNVKNTHRDEYYGVNGTHLHDIGGYELLNDLQTIYNDPLYKDIWFDTYGGSNWHEFFATSSVMYFDGINRPDLYDFDMSRNGLEQNQSKLVDFLDNIYPSDWTYSCP